MHLARFVVLRAHTPRAGQHATEPDGRFGPAGYWHVRRIESALKRCEPVSQQNDHDLDFDSCAVGAIDGIDGSALARLTNWNGGRFFDGLQRPKALAVARCGKLFPMDPLRKDDIERMKRMPPDERMRAALAAVNAGVRIRLATLRAKRPQATDRELEAALRAWLKDERPDH